MLNLKDRKFWSVALSLALPIAMQNLLTSSFTLIDTIMVGQLGDVPLSSVGMAGQLSWLLNMVLFGICSGAAVFISQYWGVKDLHSIRRTIGIATTTSLLLSFVFVILGFCFPRQIIHIFNNEPIVISTGSAYLRIVAWSYPAVVLEMVLCSSLRSMERVRLPLITSLITTITNGVLDYAMIFGKFGFPKMGIEGAAIATVIAAWTAPIVIAIGSYYSRNILSGSFIQFFSFSKRFITDFFKKALPVVLNETAWGISMVIFNIIFANLGYEKYAAVTISKTFENVMFVFFAGLGSACSIMVGKSIGAGNIKQAKLDAKRFIVISPVIGAILGIFVIIFRARLIGLFNLSNNISDVTFKTAMGVMLLFAAELPIRNIPYLQICGIFRSGGDTTKGVKYDMSCVWFFSLPATLIAAYVLKLPFVFVVACMYVFDDYPKSILCLRHFFSYRWIKPVTEAGKKAVLEDE